ncbi:MAG: HEPN domain-containing protein [Pseudomonadota bacterium]|jgi:uncharacterized protein (UPF0332 family)
MNKASRACTSAHALLSLEDPDGACNRAYYAMFDAARAVLMAIGMSSDCAKTHSGLITAFGLHLVKTGLVPVELGKAFNRAEEIRLEADYKGDPIPLDKARMIVHQSASFVAAMHELLARLQTAPPGGVGTTPPAA